MKCHTCSLELEHYISIEHLRGTDKIKRAEYGLCHACKIAYVFWVDDYWVKDVYDFRKESAIRRRP